MLTFTNITEEASDSAFFCCKAFLRLLLNCEFVIDDEIGMRHMTFYNMVKIMLSPHASSDTFHKKPIEITRCDNSLLNGIGVSRSFRGQEFWDDGYTCLSNEWQQGTAIALVIIQAVGWIY
ncbi:hypothetical protein Leryth_018626 [Lithospermum erythrorhizon]|nr:hypothetical protein Leryth_018626 [Lithospermum erythrorhizon]